MGTEKPDKLLKQWAREEISVEMAIGHLLQNMVLQQAVLDKFNSVLFQLKSDVEDLKFNTAKRRQKEVSARKNKKL